MPFKIATSTDNGVTWTLSLPQLDKPAKISRAQPITSAFRGEDNSLFFAMDGHKAQSFLWRSDDSGIHWQQMAGRTGGRHSAIVPLGGKGNLLSIGGKNASVNGWSPENFFDQLGRELEQKHCIAFSAAWQRPAAVHDPARGRKFIFRERRLFEQSETPSARRMELWQRRVRRDFDK